MNLTALADHVAPSVELARDIQLARAALKDFYIILCRRHDLSVIHPDTILHTDASGHIKTADQMYTREILALPGVSSVGEQLAYFYDHMVRGDWPAHLDILKNIAIQPEVRRAVCVLFVAGGAVTPETHLLDGAAIAMESALALFNMRQGSHTTHLVDDMHGLRRAYDVASGSFQPM